MRCAVLLLALVLAAASRAGAARLLLKDPTVNGTCSAKVEAALAEAEVGPDGELVVWGGETNYSGGTIKTYTKFDAAEPCGSGPLAVGVWISDATLENLPGPDEVAMQPPPECKSDPTGPGCHPPFDMIFLDWGKLGKWAPFRTLELDWNPAGHSPPGIYDAPHFDFHFYLVNKEEVMNISAGPCSGLSPESFAAANQPIPESCFPGANYTNMVATVPYMGNHLISTQAPEVAAAFMGENGVGAWNETFIFGSYEGEITYFEPMIKRSYLMSGPSVCKEIPGLPSYFAHAGFKPSEYCVLSVDGGVAVELSGFTWFDGGCPDEDVYAPASYGSMPPGSPPLGPECELPEA